MTLFLYISCSSKLTEEEKGYIDKSVLENRVGVSKFVKKAYVKAKVIVIISTLGISILKNVDVIVIRRMAEYGMMSRIEPCKFVQSYARLTVERQEKISFVKNERVAQRDKIYSDLWENRMTTVNELVKLRGGNLSPLARTLFRILLIWSMSQGHTATQGFQAVQPKPVFVHPGPSGPAPRIGSKLRENPLNKNNPGQWSCRANQNNQDGTLTRSQKRNLPHESDAYISEENVVVRHRQANFKMKKHGHDFDLPYYENESGRKKTLRTTDNLKIFKDKLVETTLNGKKIEGTYRDDRKVIHYFDSKTRRNVLYDADTKEFISGWKLTREQVQDLIKNKNVGKFKKSL